MEPLKGHLYLVPVQEEDTSVLRKDDEKRRIRERISTLLGLPVVPEKWLRVQGIEINSASQNPVEEDEEWILGKPPAGDVSGVVAFPRYLPADLFMGKMENDTLTLTYAGFEMLITLKQVPYQYGNHGCFEEVFINMVDDITLRRTLETPIREDYFTAEAGEKPKEKMPKWAAAALCLAGGIVVFGIGVLCGIRLGGGNYAD
jgi:hypothetical protein